MATYEYIAKSAGGEQVAGLIEADNEAAAVRSLDERQLYPVQVKQQRAEGRVLVRARIRLRDIGVMYGQLGDLLAAGVPMLRALETLVKALPNRRLADVVGRVREDMAGGMSLAEAMGQHPGVFKPLHSAMVRAGERAGFLEDVLTNLADFLDRQDELRSKVRGAMIYPVLLTGLGVVALIGILVVLVPKFKGIFEGIKLPAPTAILFVLSDLLVVQWPVLLAVVLLAVLGAMAFVRSEFGRRAWDRWRLRIPVIGRTSRMVSITRFCRILGTMLANGVPILEALSISKDATGNRVLAEAIAQATESVRAGERLADPLKQGGLFPAEILEMIAIAEESNRLEKVLLQIAATVERRTNRLVDMAVRLIEPLILVMIAAGIGFVAVGLVYPIFTMARALR